jgi:hypothetical protein
MADKNFVVKNGLEVNGSLIFADRDLNTVGIASTTPRAKVDINGSVLIQQNVTVSGASTFVGLATFNDYVYIQDGLDITGTGVTVTTLKISGVSTHVGVSTFGDQVGVNGGLTVAGTGATSTTLRVTGVSTFVGVSTFGNQVGVNGGLTVAGSGVTATTLNITGVSTHVGVSTFGNQVGVNGGLTVAGTGATSTTLNITGVSTHVGVSTFGNQVGVNGGLTVAGTGATSTTLNVTGVSTHVGVSTFGNQVGVNGGLTVAGTGATSTTLRVTGVSTHVGVSTFNDQVGVNGGLTVAGTGATSTTLNVTGVSTHVGVSTFGNQVGVNGGLTVAGTGATSTTLRVTGVSTFVGVSTFGDQVGVNGGLTVAGTGATSTTLRVTGVSTHVGVSTFNDQVGVNGGLTVAGTGVTATTLNVTGIATLRDRVIFNSTNSIQIPVGTVAERDSVGTAVTGQIRYNSQFSTFEGYGPGGQWGSLGGVKDVDGNTYIIPESSPGSNENVLYFYTDGTEKVRITNIGRVGIGTTLPTELLDVRGNAAISGVTTTQHLLVTGVSTLTSGINVTGTGVTVTTLNVSGVSTHVGVSTFGNQVGVNGGLTVAGTGVTATTLNITGFSTITSGLTVAGSGATSTTLRVTGVSTFVGVSTFGDQVGVNGGLTVAGTGATSTTLRVTGVSTFVGVSTFGDQVGVNGGLTIAGTGATSTTLRVTGVSTHVGVSTFNDQVGVNGGLTVAGTGVTATTLNVTGFSTVGNILPISDNAYNIGSASNRFANFYVANLIGNVTGAASSVTASLDTQNAGRFFLLSSTTSGISTVLSDEGLIYNPNTNNLGIGATIPAEKLDVRGNISVSGVTTTQHLLVTGISTNVGVSTFNNQVGVNGGLTVAGSGVTATTLNITGFSTISSALIVSGTGVTATTLNVSGFTTISSALIVSGTGITATTLNVTGVSTHVGVSTFNNQVGVNGGLTIAGSGVTATTLNVTGFSTISSALIVSGTGVTATTLRISGVSTHVGVSTFGDQVGVNGGLTVAGSGVTATTLKVTGIATVNQLNVGVGGTIITAETANVGIATIDPVQRFQVGSRNEFVSVVSATGTISTTTTVITGISTNLIAIGQEVIGIATILPSSTTVTVVGLGSVTLSQATLNTTIQSGVGFTFGVRNDSKAFTVTSNADVGIGTTNPTSKLHVVGDTLVTGVSTFTGNVSFGSSAFFGDNDILNLGDSNDLQILHDGANSVIKDVGTGNLVLAGDGVVDIYNSAITEVRARFLNNAAVELYYDNVKEFETTGYGATVFGTLQSQGIQVSGTGVTATTLNISGVSTHVGVSTFNNQVGVNGGLTVAGTGVTATTLNVTGVSTVGGGVTITSGGNINAVSGVVTATQFVTGAGAGITITSNTILGPIEIIIDPSPAGVGTTSGSVRIRGDLYVDGTQFVVNSTTIEFADFVIGIATTAGTNALLDGAGIGIGSTNIRKTITWDNTNSALRSSENFNLATGKVYEINGVEVLSSTQLTVANIVSSGSATISGTGATTTTLNVTGVSTHVGVSTFGNQVGVNGGLTVAGTGVTATTLNVVGFSTISSGLTVSGTGATSTTLRVTGFSTISSALIVAGTGITATTLNVTGVSTFNNNIIQTAGSVGIATTNPLHRLQIGTRNDTTSLGSRTGNIGITTNVISGISTVDLAIGYDVIGLSTVLSNPTTVTSIGIGSITLATLTLNATSLTGLAFTFSYRDDSKIFVVTSNADVGIGTTNPTRVLDVRGDIVVSGVTTTQHLLVTGISTHVGVSTFGNQVGVNGGLTVAGTGATSTTLNVTGVSTFSSSVGIATTNAFGNNLRLEVVGNTRVSGSVTFSQSASDTFNIAARQAPTSDLVTIKNTGFPIVTSGVNNLQIDFVGGDNAAVEAGAVRVGMTTGNGVGSTWNAFRILPTTGAGSTVTMNAIKCDAISVAGVGTDNVLWVGTGWDNIINLNNFVIINGVGEYNWRINSLTGVSTIGSLGISSSFTVTGTGATTTTLNVTGVSTHVGVSTFGNQVGVNGGLTVAGTGATSTTLRITGVSTFVGVSTFGSQLGVVGGLSVTGSGATASTLNITGFSTISGALIVSGTGVTATTLNVTGVSTFAGIATYSSPIFGTQASFIGVVTATDFNSSSDINLKSNVQTFTNALDIVKDLRGVRFEWKETHKPSIGVIAQELETVLPELVAGGDPKSVNYNGLIGVLIEAVKELSQEVQDLKSQLNK